MKRVLLFALGCLALASCKKEEVQPEQMLIKDCAIQAEFSVSPTKKVYFSQGNLLHVESTDEWKFSENQFEFIQNAWDFSGNQIDSIGMFRWNEFETPDDSWRLLSVEEFEYLVTKRPNCKQLRFHAKKTSGGMEFLVLLPDNYSNKGNIDIDYNKLYNLLNDDEWNALQNEGAIILSSQGSVYWTSTETETETEEAYAFNTSSKRKQSILKKFERYIRLVKDVK